MNDLRLHIDHLVLEPQSSRNLEQHDEFTLVWIVPQAIW